MNKKYKKNWIALVIGIGFWVMMGSILWAETENTKTSTITSQDIRESAENYLINHLDWDPESMDIQINYEARDFKVPEGKLLLNYGRINNPRGIGRISLTLVVKVDEKFILLDFQNRVKSIKEEKLITYLNLFNNIIDYNSRKK